MSPATLNDAALQRLAARVGARLAARDARITTAESCTGGWISKALTDVAGSSGWFELGLVTYGNGAKTDLLGVPAKVLARAGAVSEAVVRAMAQGALALAGADIAVAVSGVAGPDGGTPDKPVGTVWFAWATRRGRAIRVETRCVRFRGDRERVRRRTVALALRHVLELVP